MAASVPRAAVWAIVAVAIVRAIVAVPISVGWALVAAHVLAAPPVGCPHASPAGATIRRVALIRAVSIRATIVISVRTAMLEPAAVERVGTGSHAVGAASGGPFVAASATVRPTGHDGAAMRSTAASAFSGRRTQRRAAYGNRRSGQTNRYLAHHDAHSIVLSTPASPNQTQRFPMSCSSAAQLLVSGFRIRGPKKCR